MSALRGPRDMPGMEGYLKGCRRVLRRARAARVSACPSGRACAPGKLGVEPCAATSEGGQGERVRRACAPVCLCETGDFPFSIALSL